MKSILKKIRPDAVYKVDEIAKHGFIVNTQGRPDRDYVYRLIRSGRLLATYDINARRKLVRVPGRSLISFIKRARG